MGTPKRRRASRFLSEREAKEWFARWRRVRAEEAAKATGQVERPTKQLRLPLST